MCLIIILPWNLSLVVFSSSQLLLNLSSSLLLSLRFLSKFTALLYYCSIEPSWYPNSISFYQIVLFILLLNSSTVSYFKFLDSRSFNMFPFCTSADSSCTYNSIYWICSSATTFSIIIIKNNTYTVMNSDIFPEVLSKTCGLATSTFNLVLDHGPTPAPYTANNT